MGINMLNHRGGGKEREREREREMGIGETMTQWKMDKEIETGEIITL